MSLERVIISGGGTTVFEDTLQTIPLSQTILNSQVPIILPVDFTVFVTAPVWPIPQFNASEFLLFVGGHQLVAAGQNSQIPMEITIVSPSLGTILMTSIEPFIFCAIFTAPEDVDIDSIDVSGILEPTARLQYVP